MSTGSGELHAATLLVSVLDEAVHRVRPFQWQPSALPGLSRLDESAAVCRTVGLLFTKDSVATWTQQKEAFAPLFRLLRAQAAACFALLVGVGPGQLPGDWAFDGIFDLSQWVGAGQPTVGGGLADFLVKAKTVTPDFDHQGLIGLQYTVLAMTRQEAETLAKDPRSIATAHGEACYQHFVRVTQPLSDFTASYGVERRLWQPFGGKISAKSILESVIDDINEQTAFAKRDVDNLKGYKVRSRYYPFDPSAPDDPPIRKLFATVKRRGCLVLADELSLLEPRIRNAAAQFLDDRQTCVVALSPNDPLLDPLDAALKIQTQLGNLVSRFQDDLDLRCEVAVSGQARLRRWLRFGISEALGSIEARGPDPGARARILAELRQ